MKKIHILMAVLCGAVALCFCTESESAQSLLQAKRIALAQRLLCLNKVSRFRLRLLSQEARLMALRMLLAHKILARRLPEQKDSTKAADAVK